MLDCVRSTCISLVIKRTCRFVEETFAARMHALAVIVRIRRVFRARELCVEILLVPYFVHVGVKTMEVNLI